MPTVQNISGIETEIVNDIYSNTTQAISGNILQSLLLDMAVSYLNRLDDYALLNLRDYSTSRAYQVGEAVIYNNNIYRCITATTAGAFNSLQWNQITSSVSIIPVAHYQVISGVSGSTFNLDYPPNLNYLFLANKNNGWLMKVDYTIASNGSTITFNQAILTTDTLELNYYH